MYYDICEVGTEYTLAEECFKRGDLKEAADHYKNAILHYENADNIQVLPDPDAPYTTTEYNGKIIKYPSINKMVDKSFKQLIKMKDSWLDDYEEMCC